MESVAGVLRHETTSGQKRFLQKTNTTSECSKATPSVDTVLSVPFYDMQCVSLKGQFSCSVLFWNIHFKR